MKKTKEEQIKRLKEYAYWLLGRKNYSVFEVTSKFKNYTQEKNYTLDESDYLLIIDEFIEKGYLNDENMANSLIRSLSSVYRGPMKIRQKLMEKKIDLSYLDNYDSEEVDWFELCKEYYQNKYSTPPVDYNEKTKRYRHLSGRGYLPDHINYAFEESLDL